jgi:uncharacterized protein (TIGR00251 family)
MIKYKKGSGMSLIVEIRVVPSSGKQRWTLDAAGRIKCYLKSPAERGKANTELIQILAKVCNSAQQDIKILTGHTSRIKRVQLPLALTYGQMVALLGIEQQLSCIEIVQKEK